MPSYQRRDGSRMTKNEAMSDTLRRQSQEMRNAKTSAERCSIQGKYAAERQSIMKNYK